MTIEGSSDHAWPFCLTVRTLLSTNKFTHLLHAVLLLIFTDLKGGKFLLRFSNTPVTPVCDPTATLLRCNFHQKRIGVAENCQQILKSMRQVAHSTLLTRSLRSHCALTTLALRPMRSQFDHRRALTALPPRSTRSRCDQGDQGDLATTSLRPYYALTTSPLRSVRLYHVRAATINTASSTAGDTAMVKRRCTLWCCVEDRLYLYHLWPDRMSKSERTIHAV